jgi:DNA-binding GntR family transcriptional regulator
MRKPPILLRPDASQVERAYHHIKARIVDGTYPPGSALSEPMLAAKHGMSRTPIREGLVRLWQERYLERLPGRGYFVARVTVQSIHDTFEVRRLLEGAAAARAAELATAEDVRNLRRLAELRHSPGGPSKYRQAEAANVEFHLGVAAVARNTLAVGLIRECLAQIDRFMSLGVRFEPFEEGATEAHRDIVRAIGNHDAAAARARMEAHLDCGARLMKEALLRGELADLGVG